MYGMVVVFEFLNDCQLIQVVVFPLVAIVYAYDVTCGLVCAFFDLLNCHQSLTVCIYLIMCCELPVIVLILTCIPDCACMSECHSWVCGGCMV